MKDFIGFESDNEIYMVNDDVARNGIKKSTEFTLANSKEGGLRLLEVQGNTEQKTLSGKNLLNCSGLSKVEGSGITFTPVYDANGLLQYINVNGTATANAYCNINFTDIPPKGNLIGSIMDEPNNITCVFGYFRADNTYSATPTTKTSAELNYPEEAVKLRVYLQVNSGATINNAKVYPMLRKAEITDGTYEPYCGGVPSPNPPYQQTLYSYGECVKTILGAYQTVGGAYSSDKTFVCNKYPIPCKKGDVVNIALEKELVVYFMGYGANGYIGYARSNSKKSHTYTVADGVTHLNFDVYNVATLDSADDIGKVTITVNGQYVNPIRKHGKNVLYGAPHSTSSQGVSTTPVLNAQGNVAHYDINGTSQGDFACALLKKINIPKGEYILSLESEDVSVFRRCYIVSSGKTISGVLNIDVGSSNGSITFNITKDITDAELYFWGKGGTSFKNTKVKIMLREADVKDDTYEPHKETVAHFLTSEPLRKGDKLIKEDGLFKVERNVAEVVLDGSSDEGWYTSASDTSGIYRNVITLPLIKPSGVANVIPDLLMSTHYQKVSAENTWNRIQGVAISASSTNLMIYDENYNTNDISLWTNHLQENPMTVIYPLATPTIEVLDNESQIALNSLETFDGVTYVEFDSRVKPLGIVSEYGETRAVAIALKSELSRKDLEERMEQLERKVDSNIQYVDVDLEPAKVAYPITPPEGFTIDNSIVIAYDQFLDGEDGVFHNYVRVKNTTDGSRFLAQLTFQKNKPTGKFNIWTSQMNAFTNTADLTNCEMEGTLRVYFQRIY